MPAVSVRLLDLGLVLNIYLRILDDQLSSFFGLLFYTENRELTS